MYLWHGRVLSKTILRLKAIQYPITDSVTENVLPLYARVDVVRPKELCVGLNGIGAYWLKLCVPVSSFIALQR